MKQYTFKDGTKVIASSVEEAKAKHKVEAASNIDFSYKDKKEIEAFFNTFKRLVNV